MSLLYLDTKYMKKKEPLMKEDTFVIQRRISLTIIIIGTIVIIYKVFNGLNNGLTPMMQLKYPPLISLTSIVLVLLFTFKINHNHVKILQLVCLFSTAILHMLENYKTFYGIGMYILAIVLMHRYRFFKNWLKIKIVLLFISVITVVEISANINDDINRGSSIYAIFYILFFIIMLYLLYSDELNRIFFHNRTIIKMIIERNQYREKVENLEMEIERLENSIDKDLSENNTNQYKFTIKELEIVELLCTKRLSNKELAAELYISEGTIKQHLNKIYNKCGVRKRIDLIDLFKHNF